MFFIGRVRSKIAEKTLKIFWEERFLSYLCFCNALIINILNNKFKI